MYVVVWKSVRCFNVRRPWEDILNACPELALASTRKTWWTVQRWPRPIGCFGRNSADNASSTTVEDRRCGRSRKKGFVSWKPSRTHYITCETFAAWPSVGFVCRVGNDGTGTQELVYCTNQHPLLCYKFYQTMFGDFTTPCRVDLLTGVEIPYFFIFLLTLHTFSRKSRH